MDNALFTHCRFYLFAYMNALALPAQIEHCFNPHTARKKGLVGPTGKPWCLPLVPVQSRQERYRFSSDNAPDSGIQQTALSRLKS